MCAAQESDGNARVYAWDGVSGITEPAKWSGVESHREGWPRSMPSMNLDENALCAAPQAQAARRCSERALANAVMPRREDAIIGETTS